jgi:hypothetical protein
MDWLDAPADLPTMTQKQIPPEFHMNDLVLIQRKTPQICQLGTFRGIFLFGA